MEVSRIKDLYYVLMKNKLGNHKICKTLIRHGEIRVNDQVITDVRYPVKTDDIIMYHHIQLNAQPFVYYMMNKPADYLCANHDKYHQCVIDLIGREDCYCLGSLDIDTTGLLIITNDTSLSKKLLLPQNHQPKTYLVTTRFPIDENSIYRFEMGIVIDQDICCLPAQLELINTHQCYLTLHEGKYHQVKKMFLSCQNEVVDLKRIAFAGLVLDASLGYGEYRQLNQDEFQKLKELVCQ